MKNDDANRSLGADSTTISEDETHGDSLPTGMPDRLALALAWSKDEPWRVGEIFFLPLEGEQAVWLGRGPTAAGGRPKGTFGQQRPGSWTPCTVIVTPAISRYQVSFCRMGTTVVVHNEGKCSLLRNGVQTTDCQLTPGDLLQVGQQFLLLCCRRPERIPG